MVSSESSSSEQKLNVTTQIQAPLETHSNDVPLDQKSSSPVPPSSPEKKQTATKKRSKKKEQAKSDTPKSSPETAKVKEPSDKNSETSKNKSDDKKPPKESFSKQNNEKKGQPILTPEQSNDIFEKVIPGKLFPNFTPNIKAPEKYQHPLDKSSNLIFMLGEDDNGYYLYGEGPIIKGAYDKFLKYVEHYRKQNIVLKRLMMHSPGGLVKEGIAIGLHLNQNGWDTDSDQYMKCYSACGLIYAAGVNKRIQEGAEIGFHRPYDPNKPDTPEFVARVFKDYAPYWKAIGGSPELYYEFMMSYGRSEMFILNSKTISQYMEVEKY
jgi:hypothetical protein